MLKTYTDTQFFVLGQGLYALAFQSIVLLLISFNNITIHLKMASVGDTQEFTELTPVIILNGDG